MATPLQRAQLGRRIVTLRTEFTPPLSQKDLAHLAGVDQSVLSRIESGARYPSPPTLKKLCTALRVDDSTFVAWVTAA